MKNHKAPKTYAEGKKELETIRIKIESDDVDIDQLEDLIERGTYLIEYLTEKLRKIEEKVYNSAK